MLSPKLTINALLAIAVALTLLFFSIINSTPYSGFMLQYQDETGVMVVSNVDDWARAAGLNIGDQVISMGVAGGPYMEVEPRHIMTSPGDNGLYYPNERDRRPTRFEEFGKLHTILSAPEIEVNTAAGDRIRLAMNHARPLQSISSLVWVEYIFALAAFLMTAFVWAWKPKNRECQFLLLCGISYFLIVMPAAVSVYDIDMFYPHLGVYWWLRTSADIGHSLVAIAGVCVVLYYPTKLKNAEPISWLLLAGLPVYVLVLYMDKWVDGKPFSEQFLYFEPYQADLPLALLFCGVIVASGFQWFSNQRKPVERAQTLWVILAFTTGPGIAYGFYVAPKLVGEVPGMPGIVANLMMLSVFAMLTLGIMRSNLFQMEQYIGVAYQWAFASVIFFSLDSILVSTSGLSAGESSFILLALVLWVYLPLRQWFHNSFVTAQQDKRQQLVNESLVLIAEESLTKSESADQVWKTALQMVFSPIKLDRLHHGEENGVSDRGQSLAVAANKYSHGLKLSFAEKGARLFNSKDTELVITLNLLFEKLYDLQDAYLAGLTQERNRIRRDLHDQIGHKLLSLVYSANDEKSRTLAKETMAQLNELIQALKQESVDLSDLSLQLKMLGEESCRHSSLSFQWYDKLPEGLEIKLSPNQYLNILNIQRELLSNAIKHSHAHTIRSSVDIDSSVLIISLSDDGVGFNHNNIKPGNGLFNIQTRIEELQAKIEWLTSEGTKVVFRVPIQRTRNSDEC
ncbi:MAG: hypothetical protein COB20_04330 [SAR86 cluster bacterium]|uniref:histidine kinase n=1 Tax=SAR86 cluster bacterium TaxID=2030880 RepID=A0A2A4XAL0_9GAMM|nr:MAG: hypothetical protein COB20_04330 [SAR86 cluster bacterium]